MAQYQFELHECIRQFRLQNALKNDFLMRKVSFVLLGIMFAFAMFSIAIKIIFHVQASLFAWCIWCTTLQYLVSNNLFILEMFAGASPL